MVAQPAAQAGVFDAAVNQFADRPKTRSMGIPREEMLTFWEPWFESMTRLMEVVDTHPLTHAMGCPVEIGKDGQGYPYGLTWQPDKAPVQMTVEHLREAYEAAKAVTAPDIYFTGTAFLGNQTRGTTTIELPPYRYS